MKVSATGSEQKTTAKKLTREERDQLRAEKRQQRRSERKEKMREMVELSKQKAVKSELKANSPENTPTQKSDEQVSDKKHIGDIGLNRPGDPETREKLKYLLENDGFAFNEREKKALSSILSKSN